MMPMNPDSCLFHACLILPVPVFPQIREELVKADGFHLLSLYR